MPLHVAPPIRFIEETNETAGLIKTVDSVAVTIIKAQESASTRTKVLPKQSKIILFGTTYTPS